MCKTSDKVQVRKPPYRAGTFSPARRREDFMTHFAQARAARLATRNLITGCGANVESWRTVGAGANHWGGPVSVVPGGGVLALRKF